METKEAIRVAYACAIDMARSLPAGKTQARIIEAIRVLNATRPWTETEHRALDIVLGKAGPDVC